MFNRSRRRLAYWFTLSMGSILIVFTTVVYYRVVQNQIESFDKDLYKKAKATVFKLQDQLEPGQWDLSQTNSPLLQNTSLALDSDIIYVRWYNAQGQLVRFVGTNHNPPKQLKASPGFQTLNINGKNRETSLRQLTLSVEHKTSLRGYLQVATSLKPLKENLARTRLFLSLGVPITLGLIGLTGWVLGGLAMKPIRESYEQLQRFTADASHELRAPLAAILSNAQVGLLFSSSGNEKQHQRLENIVGIAKGMSVLISNLLFLARHEGRLNSKELEAIELVGLLNSLVDEYTKQAKTQGLNLVSDLPSDPIYFQADPELLQQALRNLLDNAFRYTVTASGHTIYLRLFTRSRHIIIQVADEGMGIPDQDLPHIFERFYRVDKVRSRQTGNFGLGLSIVQQIVQVHGGQIKAHSVEQEGTTFEMEFPFPSKF
jgi:signal transduction histidine kinase